MGKENAWLIKDVNYRTLLHCCTYHIADDITWLVWHDNCDIYIKGRKKGVGVMHDGIKCVESICIILSPLWDHERNYFRIWWVKCLYHILNSSIIGFSETLLLYFYKIVWWIIFITSLELNAVCDFLEWIFLANEDITGVQIITIRYGGKIFSDKLHSSYQILWNNNS